MEALPTTISQPSNHTVQLGDQISSFYHQHTSYHVTAKVLELYDAWTSHASYKVYKEYESFISGALILMGLVITYRVIHSFYKMFQQQEEPEVIVLDKRYTEFDTIPVCTGRGDMEELFMLRTYRETEIQLPDFDFDMSRLDGSTPRQVGTPELVRKILDDSEGDSITDVISLRHVKLAGVRVQSSSPEGSFEREEKRVDKTAQLLNEERAFTPCKLRNSPMDFSPSKKLVFKKSSSIITAFPQVTAESTVGDITTETVYSQSFSEDSANAGQ